MYTNRTEKLSPQFLDAVKTVACCVVLTVQHIDQDDSQQLRNCTLLVIKAE